MHEQNKTTIDHLEVAWKVLLGWNLLDSHNYLTINVTYITTFSKYPQQSLAMSLRKLKIFYLNGLYWALVEYTTKLALTLTSLLDKQTEAKYSIASVSP